MPESRSVFFAPTDGRAAFNRNLSNRYAGAHKPPSPQDGRFESGATRPEKDYRGQDGSRWIYVEPSS